MKIKKFTGMWFLLFAYYPALIIGIVYLVITEGRGPQGIEIGAMAFFLLVPVGVYLGQILSTKK